MSLILKMLRSFPKGRTTDELLVLCGASFSHDKRMAALGEIDQLLAEGFIHKSAEGKWLANIVSPATKRDVAKKDLRSSDCERPEIIDAVPATFRTLSISSNLSDDLGDKLEQVLDHNALLQYWRAALRSDPRGATTQVADKHGYEWTLIAGRGPMALESDQRLEIFIHIDALKDTFLEALVRREGGENALAVGWPLSVGRKVGVPIVEPVGMLAASWERNNHGLILSIEADDVLVNPNWLKSSARLSGWNAGDLEELFATEGGRGLRTDDFRGKVRAAIARQIKGSLTGEDLVSQIDLDASGVFDACALFLPNESTFTAGASRDLDAISTWSSERLAKTALGAALNLGTATSETSAATIDAGPLNEEQIVAVEHALSADISVVTGPPGTGKSQAIVSMVASVLAEGGAVLVASKNHQALDAVEDRLGSLAPDVPFSVRTLDPRREIDVDFTKSLKALINEEHKGPVSTVDEMSVAHLKDLSKRRHGTLKSIAELEDIEVEIAELLEKIAFREDRGRIDMPVENRPSRLNFPQKLWAILWSMLRWRGQGKAERSYGGDAPTSLHQLRHRLKILRDRKTGVAPPADPISLGHEIVELTQKLLPKLLAMRTSISHQRRRDLGEIFDDWEFSDGKGLPPADVSRELIAHRPLWLASILGTPRRIPLTDHLFDLVIFDEASQCDIATAIPLFARAKRAVVVGDDRQLSFIAGLGQAQDRNLMQAQGLPVAQMGRFAQSRRSLFDFALRVPNAKRVTLRRQYRSAGPIVDYINETFYGGELVASNDPDALVVPKGIEPGIAWEDVPAPVIPSEGNVNPAEVAAVVRHLKMLLEVQSYPGSVGVITPFRQQVSALESAIISALPETKRLAAELRVGTVDGFQGQERDLILFSPCVGPKSPQSGLTFFQRDMRRLNVAISRARAVAMVFGDLKFARSGQSKALRRLAAMATEPRARFGESTFDSDWERKVFHALKNAGLDPKSQYEIAGRRLDFALFGTSGVKLDLEVDGRIWHQSPDGRRKTSDLWRDHQMRSLGWKVRRFWVDDLAKDMEGCIDLVRQDLA